MCTWYSELCTMICRTYSVLAVICITCLLIFSKLDETNREYYLLPVKYRVSERKNKPTKRLFNISEQQTFPADQSHSRYFAHNYSGSSEDMENNNTRIKNMDTTEDIKKTKLDSPVTETGDAVDGSYSGQFNIKMLNEHLKRCVREKDQEVDMDEYIRIFQQLYKFFCLLGTVFGFIGSDVKSKIEILQGYREGSNRTHYETVEKMVQFEKSTDYIHSNKETSGSRTFLRLHRSLIFVSKFLSKMGELSDQDGTSRISKEAYAQTLAKFHPWLIQKGAGIAMLGLPSKKDLIAKVCANGMVDYNEVTPIMQDVIRLTAEIYDQCDKLYTEYDLHGLP